MSKCPTCGEPAMERNDDSAFHAVVQQLAVTMRAHGIDAAIPPPLCELCLKKRRKSVEDGLRDEMNSDAALWRLYLAGKLSESTLLASVANRQQYAELVRRRRESRQLAAQHSPRTKRTETGAGFGEEDA